MSEHRSTIGEFIVRFGWLIGIISLVTAGILYSISIQSLAFGLGSVDLMTNATDTSQLFAWSINLLEIIGLCWILAKEMQLKGDAKEDRYLNAVISIAMIVILAGDFSAIMYASGGLTKLPGDWFGKILGGALRVIKSIIGAAGSETLILIGLYLIIEWFQQYALGPKKIEEDENASDQPSKQYGGSGKWQPLPPDMRITGVFRKIADKPGFILVRGEDSDMYIVSETDPRVIRIKQALGRPSQEVG